MKFIYLNLKLLYLKKLFAFLITNSLYFIGVLAMEALHRQVLPFVLRRMKEDVLSDLPPKITQVNKNIFFYLKESIKHSINNTFICRITIVI
jgi:SNF2 family DNA or RNA helicase